MDSIFEPVADNLYLPTEAALSPWSDEALHGSPPTMLMAREIETFPSDQQMFVARLTVELLRPVGRTPLAITSRLVRPGRKVQLVEASLWNGEQEVARATALRIRQAAVNLQALQAAGPQDLEAPPHGPPESLNEWSGSWRIGPAYHVLGVEIRGPQSAPGEPAPGWAWFRLKLPLVPGEEPTGLVRVCAAADFPNGISYVVDPRKTSFVNADLTVYVNRFPVDDWVMVDAHTWLEPHGAGLAEGALYDRRGRVGRSVQGLIVEPRA